MIKIFVTTCPASVTTCLDSGYVVTTRRAKVSITTIVNAVKGSCASCLLIGIV